MSALDELLQELADPSHLPWRDETYSVQNAKNLSATERATYVAKLMEKAQQGDKRAILSLGHLPALEAVPMLLEASKAQVPWALNARRALVLLGSGSQVIDAIANDAVSSPATMDRVAAIMDLKKLGGSKAMKAFDRALEDSDFTVRMLAWEGLVDSYDLAKYMQDPKGELGKGTTLELAKDFLSVNIKAFNRMGAEETRDILMKIAGGASPESVGIVYQPDPAPEVSKQVSKACYDEDLAFPIDAVAKLEGLARRQAEALIASRAVKDDPRVPDALVRLHADWTAPVLEEAAESPLVSPEIREKLLEAARTLKAS